LDQILFQIMLSPRGGIRRYGGQSLAPNTSLTFARPDGLLGDIDNHNVGRAELEEAIHARHQFRNQFFVVGQRAHYEYDMTM
jgi:hypothetical protein